MDPCFIGGVEYANKIQNSLFFFGNFTNIPPSKAATSIDVWSFQKSLITWGRSQLFQLLIQNNSLNQEIP